ncbi:GAF domain-containing protein [Sphingomonas sp. UYP23]
MLLDRPYPDPDNEPLRLAELTRYAILDTPPEPVFNDVVRLAQSMFGVESSALSFVDAERQWFKARLGIAFAETRREHAFCTRTILRDAPMVVADATLDPRFSANALVVRAPNIRFYAGAPLTTRGGFNIGTVCLIDSTPRADFRVRERRQLETLAHFVMAEIDRRVARGERRVAQRYGVVLGGMVSGYGVPPTPVDVTDISAHGAMIRGLPSQLGEAGAVILTIRNMVVASTVAWAYGDRAGLKFQGEIDPVLLARMNDQIRNVAKPRGARRDEASITAP